METITHLNQMENGHYRNKGICGQQTNCGVYQFSIVPPAVHHCITREINKVSCAECADTYAQQQETIKLEIENDYATPMPRRNGKNTANLESAFKLIAAKDKEIAQLENDNKQLTSELTKSSNQVFNLNVQNAQLQGETRRLRDENIRVGREFREHKMSIMNRLQEIVQEQY